MNHLLICECGREHIVSRSQAGQEIKCDCGKELAVPTLRGLADLPIAQPAPPTSQPYAATTAEPSRSRWQGWRGPSIAVAFAGFLIALAFCGWFLLQRYPIDTSYTGESEIAAGNELLDQLDPSELSHTWYSFGKMGLRMKERPVFYLWNQYARDREIKAAISGGIAGAFGLMALMVWISARRKIP